MKKIYILTLLLAIAIIGASAQVTEFFDRYSDTEGVTSVYVSKTLLRMMPDVKTEGIEIKGLADKLDGIRILTTEDKAMADKLKNDATKNLRLKGYEELLRVNEGDEKTMIYMKADKRNINEYLIINQEPDEFNAILITGSISPSDIQGMIRQDR